jgi:hypothetical protein
VCIRLGQPALPGTSALGAGSGREGSRTTASLRTLLGVNYKPQHAVSTTAQSKKWDFSEATDRLGSALVAAGGKPVAAEGERSINAAYKRELMHHALRYAVCHEPVFWRHVISVLAARDQESRRAWALAGRYGKGTRRSPFYELLVGAASRLAATGDFGAAEEWLLRPRAFSVDPHASANSFSASFLDQVRTGPLYAVRDGAHKCRLCGATLEQAAAIDNEDVDDARKVSRRITYCDACADQFDRDTVWCLWANKGWPYERVTALHNQLAHRSESRGGA